jgi:Cu/Ag efflux protein CusF
MKALTLVSAAVLMIGAVAGGAVAQAPPRAGAPAPQMIQGEVVKIDANTGKVTVRAADGTTHEFQASRETLQDLKPGDKIEAKLRSAPGR